ncbi:unnamed protein product [Caenorhabditis sp. 36 PRJEB53466]|nr:unnamed protein product [Caenorhabditis sp. 36 PRJEB53466]
MIVKLLIFHLLITAFEFSTNASANWQDITHQLNNFRRLRANELKASNMQKLYWDEMFRNLALQKVIELVEQRVEPDKSTTFWMETEVGDPSRRAEELLFALTRSSMHDSDVVNNDTLGRPYNLAINHDAIRIGCVEKLTVHRKPPALIVLCVFGPSPLLLDDRLFSRGSVCSECPPETGCENSLCDERTRPGLPAISDLLGVTMSRNSFVFVGCVLGVIVLAILIVFLMVYFYL